MNTAPHMKAWPKWAQFLCARIMGHQDRNYAGSQFHYAYCLRCGYLFAHPWGGEQKAFLALRQYGQHLDSCHGILYHGRHHPYGDCSCGYNQAAIDAGLRAGSQSSGGADGEG